MNYGSIEHISVWNNIAIVNLMLSCMCIDTIALIGVYMIYTLTQPHLGVVLYFLNPRLVNDFYMIECILLIIIFSIIIVWSAVLMMGHGMQILPIYYVYGYIVYLLITCITIKIMKSVQQWLHILNQQFHTIQQFI